MICLESTYLRTGESIKAGMIDENWSWRLLSYGVLPQKTLLDFFSATSAFSVPLWLFFPKKY